MSKFTTILAPSVQPPPPIPSGVDKFQLTSEHLKELAKLFGGSIITSADDLVARLRRSQTVRVAGGVELTLPIEDIRVIEQQAIGMGRPFKDYFQEYIEDCINLEMHGCYKQR